MRDRKTGRIIWYLFSAVLVKWGVEIAVATFALSCGLHSNMGIGAISSIITIPMIGWIYRKDQGRYEKSRNPGGNIKPLPDTECGLSCFLAQ